MRPQSELPVPAELARPMMNTTVIPGREKGLRIRRVRFKPGYYRM